MKRREFLKRSAKWGAAGLVTGGAGVVGYTFGLEPHWVETVKRDLAIPGLPPGLHGRRMLQISDVHVGPRVSSEYLAQSLDAAAQLAPDLTVITGDLISYDGDWVFSELREVLTHLPRGRLGTLAILGNHDYGYNWAMPEVARRVAEELERAGAGVLRNEAHHVAGLDVLGLDDLWAGRFAPAQLLSRHAGAASIALCHNPDAVDLPGWRDYRGWILAGHTHGGQCKPPFLPPPLLPVRNRRYVAGEVSLGDGRQMYINRGLGHLLPVRFNVRPEITAFTLRRPRES